MGLLGAFGLSRVIASLLIGVTATDPVTFSAIPLLLAACGGIACVIPALRASQLDPVIALRTE